MSRVAHRLKFQNDDELGIGNSALNLESGGHVVIDVSTLVDVTDNTDLWLVLEEAIHGLIQVGIAEVGIEYLDRNLELQVLVCLSGGSDVASRAGV